MINSAARLKTGSWYLTHVHDIYHMFMYLDAGRVADEYHRVAPHTQTLNSEVMYLWDKLCPLLVKPVKSSAQNKVLALWTSNSVSWPEFKMINQFISLCFPFADRKTLYHRTAWVNFTVTFKYSSEISYSKIFTNTDLYGCYFSCILYLTKWSTRDGIS